MRDGRGFRTNPGQAQLHQAQGMEWGARCAKQLERERGHQRDGLAKEMPRDHGPEVASEVAELDLAL